MQKIVNCYGQVFFEHPGGSLREALIAAVEQRICLKGADLVRADLSGANCPHADLPAADLAGASLAGANLRGANLEGANLEGANLVGANLSFANLSGANCLLTLLTGTNFANANLAGAIIDAGEVRAVRATGCLLNYQWTAFEMADGSCRLRYGCEEHPLEDWRKKVKKLTLRYVSESDVPRYVRAIRALVSFVKALSKPVGPGS